MRIPLGIPRIDHFSLPSRVDAADIDLIDDMRLLANKRHQKRTVRSRAFAVLAVLWVSLGIQPCAIAATDDEGCPHCPPEQIQTMAAHDGHSDGVSESSSCVSVQAMLCEVDEAAIDSRSGKVEVDDAGIFVPVAPTFEQTFPVIRDTIVGVAFDPPARHRSAVPLHILYCVYRD